MISCTEKWKWNMEKKWNMEYTIFWSRLTLTLALPDDD